MSGMLIFTILILAGLSCFGFSLIWCGSYDSYRPDVPGFVPVISGLIFLVCGGWLFAAIQCEKKIDREIITTSTTVNNVQTAIFTDGSDTYYYNLNEEFGRTFEDGTEFKLIFYSNGPYAGLYMYYTEDMEEVK